MSWFYIKKAGRFVFLSSKEYNALVRHYQDTMNWSYEQRLSALIYGTKENKEKNQRIHASIIKSIEDEWERNEEAFKGKYSFVYKGEDIEENLYELLWAFCEINPDYRMMLSNGNTVYPPSYVDVNLSVTFKKDFYICESRRLRRNRIENQYRIKVDNIVLIYGDMMDFRICLENGTEYRFQTLLDGRNRSGSISVDVGDLSKWEILLQQVEEECLEQEKANAPERIVTTDEFQKTALTFAHDACKNGYDVMLEIEQEYKDDAMVPNMFVDFSVYEQTWLELANWAKKKHDEIGEYSLLWDKQPDRDFSATGLYGVMLNQTWHFYSSISLYAKDMAQMMHHLYEKAHGGKYTMKDYQKELKDTERRRWIVEQEYLDIKKRYRDQMKCYQEQNNCM